MELPALEDLFDGARRRYKEAGITGRVGFGKAPAVIVVDLICAFTTPQTDIGADLTPVVTATAELLKVARRERLPIIFTTMGYSPDLKEAGVWPEKFPSLRDLRSDLGQCEVDPRLQPGPTEFVVHKDYPSAFFGTSLVSILAACRVDTVVITGTTTSGCVRATAVDGLSHGYRVIVPRECVGDRAELPHVANLFDIDAKYGDVVSLQEAVAAIEGLPPKGGI